MNFPNLQIGYGFFSQDDPRMMVNRLMDPESTADLRLGEDIFEGDPIVDERKEKPHVFLFFEASEGSLIYFDLGKQNQDPFHPVVYNGIKIADSLEEFLYKMDRNGSYYLDLDKD